MLPGAADERMTLSPGIGDAVSSTRMRYGMHGIPIARAKRDRADKHLLVCPQLAVVQVWNDFTLASDAELPRLVSAR